MKRIVNSIVFIICGLLLIAAIRYVFGYNKDFVRDILAILGVVLFLALLLFMIFKSKLATSAIGSFFFGDLKVSIENLLNELPKPKNDTIASLSSQVIYRLTRIGIVGLVITCVPVWLLYTQNILISSQTKLMDVQTDILKVQNEKITQQNLLQEASRRNNLQFEISSILDLIGEELKEDIGEKGIRDLSPELEGRIIALNSRLSPYYFMEGKELIEKPLSPERGQLLLSLINIELNELSLFGILKRMDLTHMDFRNVKLDNVVLYRLDFSNSDFSNSEFINSDLSFCHFEDVDLTSTRFNDGSFRNTTFVNSDLSNSKIRNQDLHSAHFRSSNFSNAVIRADFTASILNSVSFENSTLLMDNLDKTLITKRGLISFKNAVFKGYTEDYLALFNKLKNVCLENTEFNDDKLAVLFSNEPNLFHMIRDTLTDVHTSSLDIETTAFKITTMHSDSVLN